MSPPQNANASAETGEFPALLIWSNRAGEVVSCDIAPNAETAKIMTDGPLSTLTFQLVSLSLILRAHKMEAALQAFIGASKHDKIRANPHFLTEGQAILKQAEAALKGDLSA